MEIVLVTNCSATKNTGREPILRGAQLRKGSLAQVAGAWKSLVEKSARRGGAIDVYKGPSILAAKRAAREHDARWFVASAGLGLLHSARRIPMYDLSISPRGGRSYVLRKINTPGDDVADKWWQALAAARGTTNPLRRLIRRKTNSLVVLALSKPYLNMVSADLAGLDEEELSRVRIITSERATVSEVLKPIAMPYDVRLNGRGSPVPGPMASFVQRAARHFLQIVGPEARHMSAAVHAKRVQRSLAKLRKRQIQHRRQLDDEVVAKFARKIRKKGITKPYPALRELRMHFRVACEQSRFCRIWKGVAKG